MRINTFIYIKFYSVVIAYPFVKVGFNIKSKRSILLSLFRYCSTILHDVQIVPDIDHQQDQENTNNPNSTSNGNASSRKSSTESMDSVILVQTPKHLKQPHRHSTRYSHHRHQQELLRRIQSMTSPPPTLRRVSRSTPSLTESDLEAYARGIRSIVPL